MYNSPSQHNCSTSCTINIQLSRVTVAIQLHTNILYLLYLQVLDARDPLGCRCLEIERLIAAQNNSKQTKRIILVLNKIDLVPMNIVQQWIKYLRREYPVIAFKSSTQSQKSNLSSSNYLNKIRNIDDDNTQYSGAIGGNALLELLKNFSRSLNIKKHITVGVGSLFVNVLYIG